MGMTTVTNTIHDIYSLMEEYFKLLNEYSNIGDVTEKEIEEFYQKTGLKSFNDSLNKNNISKKIVGGVKKDWKKETVDRNPLLSYYKNIKAGETKFNTPESLKSSEEWDEIKAKK